MGCYKILTGNILHVLPKSKKQPNQFLANPKSKSSNQIQSPSNPEKQKINPRNQTINKHEKQTHKHRNQPNLQQPINLEIFLGNKHTKKPIKSNNSTFSPKNKNKPRTYVARVRVRDLAIFEKGGCGCGGTRRLKNY